MEDQLTFEQSPHWQQLPEEFKSQILNHNYWHTLPHELKLYILSYLAKSNSVGEILKNLKAVKRVSSELSSLAKLLINEFTKNYIGQHPQQAYKELFNAIRANKILIVSELVNGGINVNAKIENHWTTTFLILAVENDHKQIVEILLNAGADVNAKDYWNGHTPLMLAIQNGNKDIVQMLLSAKADPNLKNNYNNTALRYATEAGNKDIVQILLEFGADASEKMSCDNTALSIAIQCKHYHLVDLLDKQNEK